MFLIYQVIDAFVDTHFHHTIAARTFYSLANVIIYEMFNALSVSNKLLTAQPPPSRKTSSIYGINWTVGEYELEQSKCGALKQNITGIKQKLHVLQS